MLLFGKVFRHFLTITFIEQVKIGKGGEKRLFFFLHMIQLKIEGSVTSELDYK